MRAVLSFFLLGATLFAATAPEQLFNGKDLSGWQMVGPGRFVVENGVMRTEGGMGLLYYTGKKLGDAKVRIVFRTKADTDNSGVVIRMPEPPPDPWYGVHNGYEVQIDGARDEWHFTGSIYSVNKVTKRNQKTSGEWNTMDIELRGPVTRISLNGEVVNEYTEGQQVPERKEWYEPVRGPRPNYGYIGLQNHDAKSAVEFREVSVLPLDGVNPIPRGDRDFLLSYLHGTRKQVLDSARGLSVAQLNFKPAADRWSILEILEHLAETEPMLRSYALSGLRNSAPAPAEKMPREKVIEMMKNRQQRAEAPPQLRPANRYASADAALRAFQERRDETIELVRQTQLDLHNSFVKGPNGTLSVYNAMLLGPGHVERHLAQLAEVKANPNFPKN